MRGKTAVANAKRAYALFGDIVVGERFRAQRTRGARPQRLLWGSTSTKNANYSDTLYVDELIGPETVNTMPPATAELFRDHGRVHATLSGGQDEAAGILARIAGVGVDVEDALQELLREGVAAFSKSYDQLLDAVGSSPGRRVGLSGRGSARSSSSPLPLRA